MRFPVLIALAFLRTGCSGPAAAPPVAPASSYAPAAAADEDPLEALTRKVFALTNRQRRLHGLHELTWNDAVARQARKQSRNMMERGFFSHNDPARGLLAARLHAAGIPWIRCGENIFREHGLDDPPYAAVDGWMTSPGHRESLLDPLFTQTGVGIAISPDTEYFITQIFIRPR
jgi:uncharacterized protein YkwD